jgi:amino acid adenylation domain-containing protein
MNAIELPDSQRRWIESVCDGRARPPAELAHRSFEARAAASAEATAVRFRGRDLTYGELNARANRLARYLADNGIGAESRVVVSLEPSAEVAVALLGVLKAGAVYVPLDPSYPPARLRAALEDIQPRLELTRERLADIEKLSAGFSGADLGLDVASDQTAYIYYTSGTTGSPKGAAASQANLASYIRSARERYGIKASDVMPAIARYSFSISMFELMSPLAAGGTLVILERDHVLDMDRLARTLADATIFHAGPSLLKNLLPHIVRHYADFDAFAGVRHASSGGDMIPPELLEGLKRVFFNAEIFVIYGCSEISCMGCTYPVPRGRRVERTFVGRPFDGMSVRVLDSDFNLLAAGVAGEIHFAGDGLVKGYWNRPDLTAEKFVELDGRRFYRTGDVGRLSEDGWLEILGRADFQVKLRGMRVELGEVEHHLRRAAGVRDAVVTARPLGGEEKALVAYVVMDHDADQDQDRLAAVRRHMSEHLPDYMLPARYVPLKALPLNFNMKIDRQALPPPEDASLQTSSARLRPPRTETEKRLSALWEKLLGLKGVGLDDRFFDLGGNSMLGINLILDVEEDLGVVLSGMEVLRESLEGQAALCDRRLGKAAAAVSAAPADNDFEAFHFGDGRSLYGVLSGKPAAREAVLICPPIGQDHYRAHFILRRLAQRLAEQGVPALRFDYYGVGDSLGESVGATCGRWLRDVADAYHELKRRTGAERISAVGARLGGALLGAAARDLEFDRLIVWDPVCDGAGYFAELSAAHEEFYPRWRRLFRPPPARAKGEIELLGMSYSEAGARELKALSFPPADLRCRLGRLESGLQWNDVARIGDLLPDAGISAALARMTTERV